MGVELPSDFLTFLAQFTGRHTFQTFDAGPEKNPKLSRVLHSTNDLASLNDQGADIFLMVNEGDGQGRGKENVTRIRAYPADFDGG